MNNLDWKSYESITKYIYETLGKKSGVKIKGHGNSCNVMGKSGVSHQIDVLTTHSDGIHTYDTAIECKYWKDKVDKNIVMKLSKTIEDTGINKGVIVSKNGFTKDGIQYAKFSNIGLVELREIEEKDFDKSPKEIEIADIKIPLNILITRPQILHIDIGNNRNIKVNDEYHYYNFEIVHEDGSSTPLVIYINNFRNEVKLQDKMFCEITKHYKISNSTLFNRQTNESLIIGGITFTGQLVKIDASRDFKFTVVDQVWLIMKSIFDERTFSISANGTIKENKSNQ